MEVRIVLSCEEGSALFSERSLSLADGGQVGVARASAEEHPGEDNVVFDCKVLSRSHAVISFVNGQVLLKDTGSRNGTFINSSRLSKPLQGSKETEIYSQDHIRFGAQVTDDSKSVKEKCIFARLRIVSSSGEELKPRPQDDKFCKHSPGVQKKEAKKKEAASESSVKEENLEDRVHSLERTLSIVQGREDKILIEITDLKRSLAIKEEQSKQLAEDLASKAGVQKDKESELQDNLDEREMVLERTLKENVKLRKELDDQIECIHKKNMDIDNLTNTINEIQTENKIMNDKQSELESEIKNNTEEMNCQKNEVIELEKLLLEANTSVKSKDKEMSKLTEMLHKDENELEEKAGAYQELETLVSEEGNTLQQAETEMRRLLDIIAEDHKTILSKDRIILKLQKLVKEKEEFINKEILILKKEKQSIENINKEKDIKILELNAQIENKVQRVKTYEELKMKSEELMEIMIRQNSEIEKLKTKALENEGGVNITDILQKEVIDLKLTIQDQDQDIKSLNSEYSGLMENNQQMIKTLQQKVINEQLINERSEEEIIQLRIELDNLRKELETIIGKHDLSEAEEIIKLKSEILKEQEITAHVQVAQEKEIMDKEKEIAGLNQILKEERGELEMLQDLKVLAGSIDKSIDTSLSETLLNDESVTLVDDTETLTIQEDLSVDEDDDFGLIEDLEIDEGCIESK